ncbi:MAG: SpoIID/LytB domain-containing protein [Solirubrobacterales bacterium]
MVRRALLLALAALLLAAPAANARAVWKIKGAGFGHGIGMSQYGAYGYAKAGTGYAAILAHYYTGTTLGATATKTVRVLLRPNVSSISFTDATSACGVALSEGAIYSAVRSGTSVTLRNPSGSSIGSCGSLLSATGGDVVRVIGKGSYHGAIEIRPAVGAGLNVINAVDLESYVRGVVPREVPSSWPIEALKAQAVAARSYALSTGAAGAGFDQYDDTRSQAYGGAGAEVASTNQAVAATSLQTVNYAGKPATTFFFSTSGGHTENIEFSFVGSAPKPYLKGVPDPYDNASPYHRWRLTLTQARMQAALARYLKGGRLKKIKVNQRGTSPRIVYATLISTAGNTRVTGSTLRTALGLRDTWAFFKKKKG